MRICRVERESAGRDAHERSETPGVDYRYHLPRQLRGSHRRVTSVNGGRRFRAHAVVFHRLCVVGRECPVLRFIRHRKDAGGNEGEARRRTRFDIAWLAFHGHMYAAAFHRRMRQQHSQSNAASQRLSTIEYLVSFSRQLR